jgi:hypothetical protein
MNTDTELTYVVEDIDHNEDAHSYINFPQELSLQPPPLLWPTEFGIESFVPVQLVVVVLRVSVFRGRLNMIDIVFRRHDKVVMDALWVSVEGVVDGSHDRRRGSYEEGEEGDGGIRSQASLLAFEGLYR